MREVLIVAVGVIIGGTVLLGAKQAYDQHCKEIPFIGGTFCAATFNTR